MSENKKKALEGKWVRIGGEQFEISDEMVMTFEGESCYIVDSEGNPVANFDESDGLVENVVVLAGYRCDVMKASIMFKKR